MNIQRIRSRCHTWLKAVVLLAGTALLLIGGPSLAAERNFQMALFGNGDPAVADLDWITSGEQMPPAPRRVILQLDSYYSSPAALAEALSDPRIDWSRVAATVIDEPYWSWGDGPNTGDWS